MPSLVSSLLRAARPVARALGHLLLVLSVVAIRPALARAQIALTHTEDAAPVQQGMLRIRATNGWTRIDERFTTSGPRALGDFLSTDSLGARQFPALSAVEQGLQTLANDSRMRLTLGRLDARSGARIVSTPVAFEYGLTRRLSVGVLVPFIQTRQTIHLTVNRDSARLGNVGFVPVSSRQAAASANALVYAAFKSAADSLQVLITRCPATPLATGCGAVNANAVDAAAARARAQGFADAVRAALGTDTSSALVAPRAQGALALAIDAQRAAVNAAIRKYLGANAGAASGVFTASTDFSYIDLQGRNGVTGLLQSPLGGGLDSIYTTNRLTTGDISVGAQYLLFDRFHRDTLRAPGLQTRMVVGGSYRFATSILDTNRKIVGYNTGDGAGVELRSALDVVSDRLAGTIAARVVKSFGRSMIGPLLGDPEAAYPIPVFGSVLRTAGTVLALDITPRYLADDYFSIDAHYGLERTGANTYDRAVPSSTCSGCASAAPFVPAGGTLVQRVGLGLRYSTVDAFSRGQVTFPVEISYTHLETITGDAGAAKVFRDQIQMRLFVRVLGGQ